MIKLLTLLFWLPLFLEAGVNETIQEKFKVKALDGKVYSFAKLATHISKGEFTHAELKYWIMQDTLDILGREQLGKNGAIHRDDLLLAFEIVAKTDPKWAIQAYYKSYRGVQMKQSKGSVKEVDDSWIPVSQEKYVDVILRAIILGWSQKDLDQLNNWFVNMESVVGKPLLSDFNRSLYGKDLSGKHNPTIASPASGVKKTKKMQNKKKQGGQSYNLE